MSDAILAELNPALQDILTRENDWARFLEVAKWLKGARRFRQLALFSERLIRRKRFEEAPAMWHLHAQALVELGLLTAAENSMNAIAPRIAALKSPELDQQAIDLLALRGRIAKQRYFDLLGPARDGREPLLAEAAKHYRGAAERAGKQDDKRYFPLVNLVALARVGEDNGWDLGIGQGSQELAKDVLVSLTNIEAQSRASDPWWNATKAECHLALGEYEFFSEAIKELIEGEKTKEKLAADENKWKAALPFVETAPDVERQLADAFTLASVTRQLNDVWNVKGHAEARVRETELGLEQALLKRQGGSVAITPESIKASDELSSKSTGKLEAVLGEDGPLPYRWIRSGMDTAKSVAAVMKLDKGVWKRIGTSFCVAVTKGEGAYALTNAHVVSDDEADRQGDFPAAVSAGEIRLRFEALDDAKLYEVEKIVWKSKIENHDATLLLLKSAPDQAKPLRAMRQLPSPGGRSRVYVIGYPKGEELCLSMQDNELLDHQGLKQPPPGDAEPVLVHYRAPTQPGSSGSPVFDANQWQVIALHHKSREQSGAGLTLSGRNRYPRANEGISMRSIAWAIKNDCGIDFEFAE